MSKSLNECVERGYRIILEDMSGITGSLYSDGGTRPTSEYFSGPNVVTTDMDDSEQWNGSEMEDFNEDESDLIEELKLNDIAHVTTQIDNSDPLVAEFHKVGSYVGIMDLMQDQIDDSSFNIKTHIGKSSTGVYHLPVDSKLMKHPEIWSKPIS